MARSPDLVLTILAARDLPRMVSFYRAAFGWTQTVDVPVYAELAMPNGQRLGIYAQAGFAANTGVPPAEPAPPGATTRTELYLHSDDVESWITRAEAAGARLLSALAPRPWGDTAAYFADPEGNVVVLAKEVAR
jgi:predicted enzyme related to lactoylglutathione lyase